MTIKSIRCADRLGEDRECAARDVSGGVVGHRSGGRIALQIGGLDHNLRQLLPAIARDAHRRVALVADDEATRELHAHFDNPGVISNEPLRSTIESKQH